MILRKQDGKELAQVALPPSCRAWCNSNGHEDLHKLAPDKTVGTGEGTVSGESGDKR